MKKQASDAGSRKPRRIQNYFWVRAKRSVIADHDEVRWLRIGDLKAICPLARPVVLVNGTFDLCHSGHKKLLFEARSQAGDGGTVVVAMDSDTRVSTAKGADRPILNFIERSVDLEFMPIDYLVEIDSDKEMRKLMELVRPDLRVQGSDYAAEPTKFPEVRKALLPRRGLSTSEIIRRIRESEGGS